MLRIPHVDVPEVLTTLRAQGATFETISSDPTVRRALWEQQGQRCAYCERKLRDPARADHRTRIEHFHPQSSSTWNSDCKRMSGTPSRAKAPTTWSNLLLCCDGNEMAKTDFTCDKSKRNAEICGSFRNPKSWTGDRLVNIDRSGRARPVQGLPADAISVIDVDLNLNANHLIAARKLVQSAHLRYLQTQKSRHNGLTASQRSQIASQFRARALLSEYGSTILSLADELATAV